MRRARRRPPAGAARGGGRRGGAAVVAVLLAAVLAGCTGDDPAPAAASPAGRTDAAPPVGCPASGPRSTSAAALPDLELACLGAAGAGVPLRGLTGRPTVLNLWASWCPPCRDELPAFARLDRDAGRKLQVVGVASQDRPGSAAEYAADTALPFPSLQDESGDLARALRRRGLPVTVLVAADGTVAKVYQGAVLTDASLRALVRAELGVDV